ncbi:MAG: methyltransferase family protein [Oceanisphaera sp.]|uniref:methyltransferase family protein n=1 Tax=Oceanisphaera sp. TaxID=1929979 RepID=UPI003F9A6B24
MNANPCLRYCIPPVIVAFTMGLMWLSQRYVLHHNVLMLELSRHTFLPLIVSVVIAAFTIMGVAAWQFRQARTTLLPFAPEQTRQLVTRGLFRYSRNPIYVGDALIILAWGLWLGNVLTLVWLVPFILYMSKVQIAAEERALVTKFGRDYQDYCQQVRRWL